MELIFIFRILYRKKWILLSCTFVAVVAAFLFTLNLKRQYKSSAQLSTGFTQSQDIKLSDEIFNLPQIDVKFNNVIENITSPKVIGLLSYSLILHDLGSTNPFRKADPSVLNKYPDLKAINTSEAIRTFSNKKDSIRLLDPGDPYQKKLLKLLEAYGYNAEPIKKNLSVVRHQRTDYIDIVFHSEDPELSAFVVNNLITSFQRYYDAFKKERSIESSVALDSIVNKKKQELENKIAAKAKFMKDSVSSTLDANMVGVNILSQISQIESARADEEGKVQSLTYQITELDKELNQGTSSNTIPANNDNTTWLALRKQYNDLLREYQLKGSNDIDIKKKLDDLQKRIDDSAPTSANSTEDDATKSQISILRNKKIDAEGQLRSARFKINDYNAKLIDLNAKLRNMSPSSSAMLDKFDKEIDAAQTEYTNANEKLNIASNMSDGLGQNFKQTLYGQPALQPEPSHRILLVGLSGFSAFALSSLFFILLAYIDQSIKTPSQFQRQTDLKLLGTVNMINLKRTSLEEQVTQIEEETHRSNAFRELLRKLRFEIEHSGKRVILFTSTEPQQGKTTLSQALAYSLSLSKKRVLLIDTNFCNNDLTVLNKANETLEQFSGNGHFEYRSLENLITKTAVSHVDIIGCRGGDYTPSEILPKNHLLNFLPNLLEHYDYVFMEAAPLNGFTDAKELVPFTEGIVTIFAATSEVKQTDRESIKFLRELDGKFIGAILNKVEAGNLNL